MKYLGSKTRIAPDLKPIIEGYLKDHNRTLYVEPFVGGANMIDKIEAPVKIGSDKNPYLVALLKHAQDLTNKLPKSLSETEYNNVRANRELYPEWYQGLVGFCCTFSAGFFSSFARGFKQDGITPRDMPAEAIANLEKQRPNLQGIEFKYGDYTIHSDVTNAVIYCDPPYRKHDIYATDNIDHEAFYKWCIEMSKNNTVLVSEYDMPSDIFDCIWEKGLNVNFSSVREETDSRFERLFKVKEGLL